MENQTTYTPDWAEIHKGYDWVAVDSDGEVYAYIAKPKAGLSSWIYLEYGMLYCDTIPPPLPMQWRTMLYKRPKPATT